MFGLGLWEIFAIILVAIVFINPKDLPKIARTLGRWYSKLRNFSTNLTANVNEIIEDEIKKPFEDIKNEIEVPARELKEGISTPLNKEFYKDYIPDVKNIMPSQDYSFLLKDEDTEEGHK